jgi:acetylglutamate kinase
LASIGRREDVELYLNLFRSERPESFAILALAGDVDREALEFDLHYLERLGLHPHVAAPSDDLAALAAERKTHKLVFLGPWRGLEPAGGPVPSLVDLTTEYDELLPLLPDAQKSLLTEARRIIDSVDHTMTVAVTSPLELLRELFTVRGAGTLIRRGALIERHASYDMIDRDRLVAVMESAFGEPPAVDFFDRATDGVYIAGDYAGAAVIAPSELGPYLTKFAVDRRAQGEGIGRDLWRAICADCPTLFWRSRDGNGIGAWYVQQCDGMARAGDWQVFWRGLDRNQIPRAIELALASPIDFARA